MRWIVFAAMVAGCNDYGFGAGDDVDDPRDETEHTGVVEYGEPGPAEDDPHTPAVEDDPNDPDEPFDTGDPWDPDNPDEPWDPEVVVPDDPHVHTPDSPFEPYDPEDEPPADTGDPFEPWEPIETFTPQDGPPDPPPVLTQDDCVTAETTSGFLDKFQTPGDDKVVYCHRAGGDNYVVIDSNIDSCLSHWASHVPDLFPSTLCDS